MTLTSYETQVLNLLAASAKPIGTFEVADRLQSRPTPAIDAPDEDPVREAWTEERIDLVQSTISLCAKGLADVAVPADGENGDRFVATDAGRAFLAQQ
ncbi:hypothetical protein ACFQ71_36115 [Streptomyces sp. NPDC056534]|uniref:hypothetical protein n=1 Tax=Streptomyces sp. NPDC056534 TaxID=3345857 RepID=UPI0036B00733